MKGNSAFVRKVSYLVCMAVLLVPLSFISRPAAQRVSDDNVVREDPGGWLRRCGGQTSCRRPSWAMSIPRARR